MPLVIGDHAKGGNAVEPGVYSGIIESVTLVMENGSPKLTQNGKELLDVSIRVSRDLTLNRRMAISYGQNKADKKWAVLAKFIEAATGIRCGDKEQRKVTDDDLIGKTIRCTVEINENDYADVVSFMPPASSSSSASKPTQSGLGSAGDQEYESFPEEP